MKIGEKNLNEVHFRGYEMNKEIQKLIDERQGLIDRLCMEIVNVEEGNVKVPK